MGNAIPKEAKGGKTSTGLSPKERERKNSHNKSSASKKNSQEMMSKAKRRSTTSSTTVKEPSLTSESKKKNTSKVINNNKANTTKSTESLPEEICIASTTSTSDEGEESVVVKEEEKKTTKDENTDDEKRTDHYIKRGCGHITLHILFLLVLLFSLHRFGVMEEQIDEVSEAVLDRVHTFFPEMDTSTMSRSEKRTVGRILAEKGAKPHLPIVMVPGFVTSGLEVWSGKDCMKKHFRQRIWAAMTGAAGFLVERECWMQHMMLDPITGNDPEDIKVRPSEGFAATDYFMMNYWVWGKLVNNLSEVGYTSSTMVMQPYDWRLPFHLLEERDGFFSNLKAKIETLHKHQGKKVVLASHSMGAMVVHHFFGWVTTSESEGGGGGGDKWVDEHLHTFINIAGSHLGVPKAATALLSGEMSDTVFDGRMAQMVESFFGRKLRRNLWSSWGSLWAMLPKGGNRLWSPGADMCVLRYENDTLCSTEKDALSPLVTMTDEVQKGSILDSLSDTLRGLISRENHSVEDILQFLMDFGSGLGPDTVGTRYHSQYGEVVEKHKAWYDVTRSPLPHAPDMRVVCMYGTGNPTERAYHYKRNLGEALEYEGKPEYGDPAMTVDPINNKEKNVTSGVKYSDGDGSVPLLSLGYVCADAWTRKSSGLNPSGTKVYTREYVHKTEFRVEDPMRGGPASSDHVDILGNDRMMEDFIKLSTNFQTEDVLQDDISSDIKGIAASINAHPEGGIFKEKSFWEWEL